MVAILLEEKLCPLDGQICVEVHKQVSVCSRKGCRFARKVKMAGNRGIDTKPQEFNRRERLPRVSVRVTCVSAQNVRPVTRKEEVITGKAAKVLLSQPLLQ